MRSVPISLVHVKRCVPYWTLRNCTQCADLDPKGVYYCTRYIHHAGSHVHHNLDGRALTAWADLDLESAVKDLREIFEMLK